MPCSYALRKKSVISCLQGSRVQHKVLSERLIIMGPLWRIMIHSHSLCSLHCPVQWQVHFYYHTITSGMPHSIHPIPSALSTVKRRPSWSSVKQFCIYDESRCSRKAEHKGAVSLQQHRSNESYREIGEFCFFFWVGYAPWCWGRGWWWIW